MSYKNNTWRGFTQNNWVDQALPDNAPAKGHTAAFTLIELLVVVLIIGILAAVAMPRYRLSVDKAHYSELMALVRNIKVAQEVFYLNQGRYAADCEELGIDLPTNTSLESEHKQIEDNKGKFILRCGDATGVLINESRQNLVAYALSLDHDVDAEGNLKRNYCWATNKPARDNTRWEKLCKNMCGELTAAHLGTACYW